MSAEGSGTLRIAAVQMNSKNDKDQNIATALRLIDRAAAEGARLIALPEVWSFLGDDEGSQAAAEPIPDRKQRHPGPHRTCGSCCISR